MIRLACFLVCFVGFHAQAETVAQKKERTAAETYVKDSFAKIKGCKVKGSYDWKAFDKIKFENDEAKSKALNDLQTQVDFVVGDLNTLCEDKDYSSALSGSLVVRPIEKTENLVVKKEGSTIIVEDKPGYVRVQGSYEPVFREKL
jgi:hypothetical protein